MDKSLNVVFKPKKPKQTKTKDSYVGIEIEFISYRNQQAIAKELKDLNLDKISHLKRDGSIDCDEYNCTCELDCTCNRCVNIKNEDKECTCGGYEEGHELAIICKENELQETCEKLSKLFKKIKADVNDSCGLHVPLDMKYRNKKRVFENLLHSQDLLYSICSPEREHGEYSSRLDEESNINDAVKHQGINANTNFETIELRMHEGTVDTKEIYHWIKLLIAIANHKDIFKYEFNHNENEWEATAITKYPKNIFDEDNTKYIRKKFRESIKDIDFIKNKNEYIVKSVI